MGDGVLQAVLVVVALTLWGLWLLHRLWARALLYCVRDIPVFLAGPVGDVKRAEQAVIAWVTLVPCLIFLFWYGIVYAELAKTGASHLLRTVLSMLSSSMLVYHYLALFRQKPVRGPNWYRFLAAEERKKLDLRLKYIEETLRVRLWLRR